LRCTSTPRPRRKLSTGIMAFGTWRRITIWLWHSEVENHHV
jgi:hypothetical protein